MTEQLSCLSDGLIFRTASVDELLGKQSGFLQGSTAATNQDQPIKSVVNFPIYKVAVLLFENYQSKVDHMCGILHIPTIRYLIKAVYLRITQSEYVCTGQAALLLSIFALSAYFYQPAENSEVAQSTRDAVDLAKILSKGALNILDYSRRSTSGSLEDVQAYIIMSFVIFHLDGFSTRGRVLANTAASIARDLRLHQLDADEYSTAEKEFDLRALVAREVKRRVFWHIAATDWYSFPIINEILLLTCVGCSQPYLVHRRACISFIRIM